MVASGHGFSAGPSWFVVRTRRVEDSGGDEECSECAYVPVNIPKCHKTCILLEGGTVVILSEYGGWQREQGEIVIVVVVAVAASRHVGGG